MPSGRLSKRLIDGLRPQQRDVFVWDESLKGFGIKVTPAGSKVFIVQYRLGGRGSSTIRSTIGKEGLWDVTAARVEAQRLLRMAESGDDPRAAKRQKEHDARDLAFPAYVERFLDKYGAGSWKTRTLDSRGSDLRRWIVPALRYSHLKGISRKDIVALLDSLPSEHPALPRNVFSVLSKLFTWAVQRGDIAISPMQGMQRPPAVASRDRVLTTEEVVLISIFSEYLGNPFRQFFELLLLTGQRRNEVANATWDELDRASSTWTIPGTRTKNSKSHSVPLSRATTNVLDDLADGTVWPSRGYVFSTNGHSPISGFSKVKARLDDMMKSMNPSRPLPGWRIHDIRRTVATELQKLGVRFEVIEGLLNHAGVSKSGIAGVYQRYDWADEKRVAMQAWNDRIISYIGAFKSDRGKRLAADTAAQNFIERQRTLASVRVSWKSDKSGKSEKNCNAPVQTAKIARSNN